jgi:hypothetical protein
MKGLRGALRGFGVGLMILFRVVLLALLRQIVAAGEPFEVPTPSTAKAAALDWTLQSLWKPDGYTPDLWMKILADIW